ncbi:DEAD/DEAH box helicase [Prolixibacteraceae bacterium JC049]|nr:DEAD/DEAH box helicase [Prolixibacteraceae bacterium JC049]
MPSLQFWSSNNSGGNSNNNKSLYKYPINMCNLKSINYPLSKEYSSGTTHEPIGFYLDALSNSKKFDLLLGYFSSSAISVLALGFTKFLANGGHMRMAINQFLRKEDKEAITNGLAQEPEEFYGKELSLTEVKNNLSETGKHFFNCIAWLIAQERIEIKIIKPKGSPGIAHYKSGIFSDNHNKILFKGSCNFTANALFNNLEEIGVKCSWDDSDYYAIEENQKKFDDIFSEKAQYIEYLDASEIEEVIVNQFGNKNFENLIADELLIIQKKQKYLDSNPIAKNKLADLEKELKNIEMQPKFPYDSGPRDYQAEAYKNWSLNNNQGVFAMATGTGKTITSLNCLLQEYQKTKLYQAVILVPTNDLQKQWIGEVQKFNIKQSVIVVGVDPNWKRSLSKLTTSLEFGAQKSFVIIATYSSFARNSLQNFLKYLPQETLLIADEAHNIASPKMKELLPSISFQKRIGLSATPKRIYDDEGTQAMNKFFNDVPPYTYEYTMEEAIAKGILCQYEYFPHIIELTFDEMAEYKEMTLKLLKFFDPETNSFKDSDAVNFLKIKRKRIIHKAENKLPVFRQIVRDEFKERGNLKYTFVYVPEGYDNNQEDQKIISQYNQAIMSVDSTVRVAAFTGETENREEILSEFEKGNIHTLSAMKCLDEGVDVPRTELAIFCSSSANPRQFIQRRGRILRQHNKKMHAVIHDLIVIPRLDFNAEKPETYNMERSQVLNELKRVADFSFMAINQFKAIERIQPICDFYELDLFEIKQSLQ